MTEAEIKALVQAEMDKQLWKTEDAVDKKIRQRFGTFDQELLEERFVEIESEVICAQHANVLYAPDSLGLIGQGYEHSHKTSTTLYQAACAEWYALQSEIPNMYHHLQLPTLQKRVNDYEFMCEHRMKDSIVPEHRYDYICSRVLPMFENQLKTRIDNIK